MNKGGLLQTGPQRHDPQVFLMTYHWTQGGHLAHNWTLGCDILSARLLYIFPIVSAHIQFLLEENDSIMMGVEEYLNMYEKPFDIVLDSGESINTLFYCSTLSASEHPRSFSTIFSVLFSILRFGLPVPKTPSLGSMFHSLVPFNRFLCDPSKIDSGIFQYGFILCNLSFWA